MDAYIRIDPRYFRPTEFDYLLGDPSKAKTAFGWKPEVTFDQLVKLMVAEDLEEAKRDLLFMKNGFNIQTHYE